MLYPIELRVQRWVIIRNEDRSANVRAAGTTRVRQTGVDSSAIMVGSNTLRGFWLALALTSMCLIGCAPDVALVSPPTRHTIDRSVVEYPAGYRLQTIMRGLTGPTAITFDKEGSLIVADRGLSDNPRIFGFKPSGSRFEIWPEAKKLPFNLGATKQQIRGPIGGMVAAYGSIYIYHRDDRGPGALSRLWTTTDERRRSWRICRARERTVCWTWCSIPMMAGSISRLGA